MIRSYVHPRYIDIEAKVIRIADPQEIRHLTVVRRLRLGEEIFISDGEGGGYVAVFSAAGKKELLLPIKEIQAKRGREERRVKLTVACAVPKYAGFEDVIDKGTQLEVDAIVPIVTERTQVTAAAITKKKERWERLMIAAAKQSGALFLPRLRPPMTFDAYLAELKGFDLCLLPHLAERMRTLPEILSSFFGGRLCVMIGPEGDFSPEEIRKAVKAGCQGVSLGESVLRVDTAAISVMSYIHLSGK